MKSTQLKAGFTLIELMIVVAIIAIVASIAIPKLMAAKLTSNETAAVATLKTISSAQAQLQSACSIDCDGDGGGEFGYLGELSGVFPLRLNDGMQQPTAGVAGVDNLQPAVLGSSFGLVQADAGMNGCVTRSGYVFKIYLPNNAQTGVGELTTGGADPAAYPESNAAEILWCAYAWPIVVGQTGNRVFFINQEGEMVAYNNRGATRYTGIAGGTVPAWNAAINGANMAAPTAVGVAGSDMNVWTSVQ